jgi:hypothetical protein
MKVSITCITRNRKFSKALTRHSAALTGLEQVGAYVNTFGLPFDVLQVICLDRSEEYARAIGSKGDRLFQVEVAAPPDETFADEAAFVSSIAGRLRTAIKLCNLPNKIEKQLDEAIAPFQKTPR